MEVTAGKAKLVFSDGVNLRYCNKGETIGQAPATVEFDDGSSLVGWVQMYGGLSAFPDGKNDNKYYLIAKEKPSPLSSDFDKGISSLCLTEHDETVIEGISGDGTKDTRPG